MVINTRHEIKNLDHDFPVGPKHYFHCSVYKLVHNEAKWTKRIRPEDCHMLTNIGPSFCIIRSGYHSKSTSSTHMFDMCNILWNRFHMDSYYKPFNLEQKFEVLKSFAGSDSDSDSSDSDDNNQSESQESHTNSNSNDNSNENENENVNEKKKEEIEKNDNSEISIDKKENEFERTCYSLFDFGGKDANKNKNSNVVKEKGKKENNKNDNNNNNNNEKDSNGSRAPKKLLLSFLQNVLWTPPIPPAVMLTIYLL